MKCDMRYLDADQVELRLVVKRDQVDALVQDAKSYGQACRAVRERIEASLGQAVTLPPVLKRIN